jgi:preprotein translocase subunit SecB
MKPKNSPLSLSDIYIVASNLIAVPTPEDYVGEINSFSFEIDFDIYQQEDDKSQFRIMVSVDGNDPENPVPGYCFNIIAEGVFNFDKGTKVNPEDLDVLLSRSAIPIVIGHIRAYLSTITSSGPYEKFLLPVIDFNDLIHQKSKEPEANK